MIQYNKFDALIIIVKCTCSQSEPGRKLTFGLASHVKERKQNELKKSNFLVL